MTIGICDGIWSPPGGGGGGGAAPVAQTEAADTSAGPVTVTLPALAGLEGGYIVRVYDAGSNASANNITIEDADSVEVAVIDEDDGERYLVVVGGAWEVRGYLPLGTPDPTPNVSPATSPLLKRPKPLPGPTVTLSLAPPTTTDIAPAAAAFDEVL